MIGHGIEIIATAQIEALIEQAGTDFELEYFTALERSRAKSSPAPIQYLSSRLAAKKAVLRVLGMAGYPDSPWKESWKESWKNPWHDVEIQRLPSGAPIIVLYGRGQDIASERGISHWFLSLSHTASYAAASAIAL